MKIRTIKPGTKVKIVESKIRKINYIYKGATGVVVGSAIPPRYRGRIRVRTKAKSSSGSTILHWYPEELKVIEERLKHFRAWK
jgi:hypothetical protein